MRNPTILVTGAAGMLGSEIVNTFYREHKVIAVHHNRPLRIQHENITPLCLDLTKKDQVSAALNKLEFDIVIHCAASINLEFCGTHFEETVQTNVYATKYLIDALKNKNLPQSKFVFISSDAVYPDIPGRKDEGIIPEPLNVYGMSKLWSENLVRASGLSHLVFRTTVVGPEENQFFGWILKNGLAKQPLRLFDDVFFTPISVRQVAQTIKSAFAANLNGTYNLCNSESTSKAKFAERILEKIHSGSVRTLASLKSIDSPVHRSFNMAMDAGLLERSLKQKMPTLSETVADVFEHLESNKK